ncbi:MAG: hypothetical protein B1H09_07595 [Gemmatimonadaceae bacterium 4484_173]|nr:MAG: hypothetical protein B1H09_07595 [Gemmatimonadaceae bacterium 4484_173]
MRELTVEEIVRYAQNIEKESYNFYKEAGKLFSDENLKKTADELAESEMLHLNRLRKLLDEKKLTKADLEHRVSFDTTQYDQLVNTEKIPENASVTDIFNTALMRETKTAEAYRLFVSFTGISTELSDLFEYLYSQEEGHASLIRNRLNQA